VAEPDRFATDAGQGQDDKGQDMDDVARRLSMLSPAQRAALLKQVGDRLVSRTGPDSVIPRRDDATEVPLSYLQEQLWFLDQLAPGQTTYNVPSVFRLRGPLDVAALRHALAAVVARHEALRATFGARAGESYQVFGPAEPAHETPLVDAAGEDEALALVTAEVRRPFALDTGPLFRSLLVRLGPEEHILAMTMHHIVSDGWSTAVLTAELSELYRAHRDGGQPDLPELAVRYGDYVAWQRRTLVGAELDAHLEYWDKRLAGLSTLELATDRPRPATLSFRSRAVATVVGADLLASLRRLSAEHGVTLFMTLMTAYHVVLARYTGQDDIVVGTTTTGRDLPELEPLIGDFVNMVVLRTDVSGDPTFAELLERVRDTVLGAWRHQQVPFEKVVDQLAPTRDPSRNPLFQVGLQLIGSATRATEPVLPALTVESIDINPEGHPFDLSVTVTESPDRLRMLAEYSVDLFDEPRVARLLGHLEQVLTAAVADPHTRLSGLTLLTAAEREQLLVTWQGPPGEPARVPVHTQVLALADARPELVAACLGDAELTYGELARRARVLARRLRGLGVGREDVVGLVLHRGFDVFVAMLAAQIAGGAYVVLDPGHPERRLGFILAEVATKAVVTSTDLVDRLPPPDGWATILIDAEWDAMEAAASAADAAGEEWVELADETTLAYVLYTSGSTGRPKGVMIEHRAMNTFMLWLGNRFNFQPGDRMLQHMALIFDFAEGEIFTAFTRGITMVLVPEEHRVNPDVIGEMLARERIKYVGGPPAILGRVPVAAYPDLTCMIAGGEAVTGEVITRWRAPGRTFINGYGPAEATVGCVSYASENRVWTGQPPIGSPMPNRLAYVLDRYDNPQPVGVPGEIVIGGQGLARGYVRRPELTAEKFVANPFRPGEVMYRTGDLGLWTEDGQLQFLGRMDSQVKLNGLRIELEEIESALVAHPAVAEAAVAVRTDRPGNHRLVGYLVPASGQRPNPDEVRAHLLADLPPYMVPQAFVTLDALPLTGVGKVDRAALPAPEAEVAAAFVAPRTPAEERVADIFAVVLGVEPVGADDNFFDIGGNSLQAARVLSRVSELGVDIRMRDFYTGPRVSDLARIVDAAGVGLGASAASAASTASSAGDVDLVEDERALEQEIADLERRLRAARAERPTAPGPGVGASGDAMPDQ
jgi:nonribosomal peptide synthetase DhbF